MLGASSFFVAVAPPASAEGKGRGGGQIHECEFVFWMRNPLSCKGLRSTYRNTKNFPHLELANSKSGDQTGAAEEALGYSKREHAKFSVWLYGRVPQGIRDLDFCAVPVWFNWI